MKEYPTIPGVAKSPKDYSLAFYKYDGSNLRFEWNKKVGWNKFGTRHRLFDKTDPVFSEAIDIFHATVQPKIEPILIKNYREAQEFTAYCEFFGDESFSGQHKSDDKTKRLVLFDVNVHKRGFIGPRDFIKLFGHLDITAKLVYEGNISEEFIQMVRTNTIPGVILNEGVICKGGTKHDRWMTKIKTNQYLEKLKAVYADGWQEYWE